MPRDEDLDEVDQKIDEAKAAARDEEESSPAPEEGDKVLPADDPVYHQNEQGFSPS